MFGDKKVVFAGGVFDLFHIGHLHLLQRAKTLGDILIVGVSSDALVFLYKHSLPIISEGDRVEIVRNISCVDMVVIQNELASVRLIQKLFVDVFVSGDDWKNKVDVPEGYKWIRENLEMVFLPRTEGIDSSSIKEELNRRGKL